ncbi:glycoside hydrolase family 3 N-terminal domain-containing protein [Microbulbifer aggregans]|uniref:glycoside hydrolase family 3 N-terminal domain-containing protein n=1 Tax=Microbulbifer aggregans TaxID=1769779 RepID=UPI001CFD1D9B|nr:glycoside hydrolase family 3 N-terminal domain-containing protein [Microbulbifer aggregans]
MAAAGCSDATEQQAAVRPALESLSLREKIAQKLMLDIRYYCADAERPQGGAADTWGIRDCDQAVTQLPPALADVIRRTGVGGIILFADNLQSSAQIVQLNRDLQLAASSSRAGIPLLIGVDQEGGRVNRLPRDEAAAFAGNMAIGATQAVHGERFATATAEVMAEQLSVLGFNVNFAPTLDVNSNPDNPVINVRSYSESPQVVADLGAASVTAFQRKGVAATVKHFPGHGDTSVDSHTGLPRVERSLESARSVDLLPFAEVFERSRPALTMTAHIQYPALDNSTMLSKSGEDVVVPATLSRKILTDLLREKMGYEGVIVTDALDMAGISNYFSADEAVVHTFAAGADIALMPVKIRFPEDLTRLDGVIDRVETAVLEGELALPEIELSTARVLNLKQRFVSTQWMQQDQRAAVADARRLLATPAHRVLASELSTAALTSIFQPLTGQLPIISDSTQTVQVLAPSAAVGAAFKVALSEVTRAKIEVLDPRGAIETISAHAADLLIVASIVPAESAVELGGVEDLARLKAAPKLPLDTLYRIYRQGLQAAREQGGKTVFVSMRSPYEAARFADVADVHLASFDYKAFIDVNREMHGPVYRALASALVSSTLPQGELPVTVRPPVKADGALASGK